MKKQVLKTILSIGIITTLISFAHVATADTVGSESFVQAIQKIEANQNFDFNLKNTLRDTQTDLLDTVKVQLGISFSEDVSPEYIEFLKELEMNPDILDVSEEKNVQFNEFAAIYINRIASIIPIDVSDDELKSIQIEIETLLSRTFEDIKNENLSLIINADEINNNLIQPQASFSVSNATKYAKKHALNYNTSLFRSFDNDCTNFISQIGQAGGLSQNYIPNASGWTWWYSNSISYSTAWTVAQRFFEYHTANGATTSQATTKSAAQSAMTEGTFVGYWKKNTYEITHASYVSQKSNGKAYITQHTTDRLNTAWDSIDVSAYSSFILLKY